MPNLFRRLLTALAGSSRDDLRRQVQFLKAENEILRAKIKGPVRVTPAERSRLIRLGKPLGQAITALVSIVRPATFLQWVRDAGKPKRRTGTRKPGRPRTPEQIRRIVLRIARETGFGYVRILGELKKLGIGGVSRSTVVNILKQPAPTDPAALTFLTMTTKPSFRAEFKAGEGGKTAVYMARWINTRGEKGPWSEVTTATVAA